MRRCLIMTTILSGGLIFSAGSVSASPIPDALNDLAEAWRGADEFVLDSPITLGIWVDGTAHTVVLSNDGGRYSPEEPVSFDWGFEMSASTLARLASGEMSAFTALGQARADDPTPLQLRLPKGFAEQDRIRRYYLPLTAHFWNTRWPESYRFNVENARIVHGAHAVPLIYTTGLRSAWYSVGPGQHINEDPSNQINSWDTAVIMTRGTVMSIIDGQPKRLTEGNMTLIPGGTRHEFKADGDTIGEFIILMYGDGA